MSPLFCYTTKKKDINAEILKRSMFGLEKRNGIKSLKPIKCEDSPASGMNCGMDAIEGATSADMDQFTRVDLM